MIDTADLKVFAEALRRATDGLAGPELDNGLDELGWIDALEEDPQAIVEVLFENQGRTASSSAALTRLMAVALQVDVHPGETFAIPRPGRADPPGRIVNGNRVVVDAVSLVRPEPGGHVVVACAIDDAFVAVRVPVPQFTITPMRGIDPGHGLFQLISDHEANAVDLVDAQDVDWESGVAAGRRAVAHELIGVAAEMLALAKQHALTRVQFGTPIAGFQAIRHRLADAFVAVEGARACVDGAWVDGSAIAALMAKGVAGRNAKVTMRHSQQVLAGIGFTYEHPFHRYLRRVLLLDELLGSSRTLTNQLGMQILQKRKLPSVLPL